jgi:hypothetical protein
VHWTGPDGPANALSPTCPYSGRAPTVPARRGAAYDELGRSDGPIAGRSGSRAQPFRGASQTGRHAPSPWLRCRLGTGCDIWPCGDTYLTRIIHEPGSLPGIWLLLGQNVPARSGHGHESTILDASRHLRGAFMRSEPGNWRFSGVRGPGDIAKTSSFCVWTASEEGYAGTAPIERAMRRHSSANGAPIGRCNWWPHSSVGRGVQFSGMDLVPVFS